MKTFDYVSAWDQAARPAYEALPHDVRELLARVAVVAADLHQLPDCSMPWPDEDMPPIAARGFRQTFRDMPTDVLALASRVINSVGHWYAPTIANGYAIPGRHNGATWKFSHYADQELRERLGLPAHGTNGRDRGFGYAVHEGAIRVTYADDRMWVSIDVMPATPAGLTRAHQIAGLIRGRAAGIDKRRKNDIRDAYSAGFEHFRIAAEPWPDAWRPFVDHRFMIEEDAMKAREASRPEAVAKTRADLIARTEKEIADLTIECDGKLWLLDHGLAIDNCIYYNHAGIFTFGWRDKVSAVVVSQILDVISEFPYPYAIKCADGRTLEGGIG